MSLFSRVFGRSRRPISRLARKAAQPQLEALEDRRLLSCTVVSGFVYQDVNSNGVKDAGELAIANNPIQLKNASGQVVASAVTDAAGFYEFAYDSTISTAQTSLTKTVAFPSNPTNWTLQGLLDQFDPTLGQLQAIEITHSGSITSAIKVENTSPLSASNISGTLSGQLTLSAPGVNNTLALNENVGNYSAAKYDGVIDFGGASGTSFAGQTADGTQTFTLTGAAMSAYVGTGKVTVTETATATSTASGGGNLLVSIGSSGAAQVTVVYKYLPSNCLKPGNYTIVQTQQPAGFLDGMESANGFLMANSVGSDIIPVALAAGDSTDNNFGEVPPGQISGFVYHDANNNGIKDGAELGISGVTVALSGGAVLTASSDATGFYQFQNLAPGLYSVAESQAAGWLDGKDSAGPLGGSVSNDLIANITLPGSGQSINNNFGELQAASLAGFVYVDANNNGSFDLGETPIQGVTVALTGADADGFVNKTGTTNASGLYEFTNLKPGIYALTETQPQGYMDGKDTIGTQGGQVTNDAFASINLQSGQAGSNNNFGEFQGASLSGFVYLDANNNGSKDAGEAPIQGAQLTLSGNSDAGPVSLAATTNASGFYEFANLRPGTFTLTEAQPPGVMDGKDTIGSQGGQLGLSTQAGQVNDVFTNIVLAAGANGVNNNFGEFQGATLRGFVYVDKNDNGIKNAADQGIAGATVALTGFDDIGPISLTTATNSAGAYEFANLRPGTYAITETQPANFNDGKDTLGSAGGQASNDTFVAIVLGAGLIGSDYNFGELRPLNSDLAILKTVSSSTVLLDALFSYTLKVTNHGADAAQNIVVKDALPSDLTFVSATGSGWTTSFADGMLTATKASLDVNQTSTITVTVRAPKAAKSLTNTGAVTSDTPDSNLTNNQSTATVLVEAPPPPPPTIAVAPPAAPTGNKLFLMSFPKGF